MQTSSTKKISPISWVSSVYFAMSLPVVMMSDVAVVLFKDMGIADRTITFWVSLLILPWSLKPIISPLMELFGTKKQYVILTELISAIMLGLIASGLAPDHFFTACIILMAVMAFAGTVHDIAGDGTYMHFLDRSEQAKYIGWQSAFYNIAKVFAKGGLVYLVGRLNLRYELTTSWKIVYLIAAVMMLLLAIYHVIILPGKMRTEKRDETRKLSDSMNEVKTILFSFFQKKHIVIYLAFILLYHFTEGLAIKVTPLFLKADRAVGGLGLSNEHFGILYGTLGMASLIISNIASGYFINRRGLKNVLFPLVLILNLPVIIFFLLSTFAPTGIGWLASGVAIEQFCYGFGFAGLNLFMMQQITPGPYQMAHYGIATGIMNLSYLIPGIVSGTLSDAVGYKMFFLIAIIVAIPGIICAKYVPFTHREK